MAALLLADKAIKFGAHGAHLVVLERIEGENPTRHSSGSWWKTRFPRIASLDTVESYWRCRLGLCSDCCSFVLASVAAEHENKSLGARP
jgi:hypothetical protein